ncbi:MAG: thiamine pyrophosphate-dependent dehydrogenase E1 component subunit alpha [Desulfobacula sp.]|nr:thiamine pyrophosphate-dependent dehydrogenase E1 component subunit alpha [Desulfobacula sp.]
MIQKEIQIDLYHRVLRIRMIEEAIALHYKEWEMRCPVHLCVGQEAVGAAVGLVLKKDDFVVSTHRSHGHYLGKGGDLKRMIAELYGKQSGCSSGKGGSMHLIDLDAGFMGSTAIVGGTIPVGVGLGLSIVLNRANQISCIFLGDGSTEEGVFYEAVNFAVLKKLPVLFICENNLYSVYSSLSKRQPEGRKIHKLVEAMGCPADFGNGNNALEVFFKTGRAADRVRKDGGPYFIEYSTYRWLEHCGPNYDNTCGYRTEKEFLEYKAQDPVKMLEDHLIDEGEIDQSQIDDLKANIQKEIDGAFDFAKASKFPDGSETFKKIFHE